MKPQKNQKISAGVQNYRQKLGWPGEIGDVLIPIQHREATEDEIIRTDIELQSAGRFHIILEAK